MFVQVKHPDQAEACPYLLLLGTASTSKAAATLNAGSTGVKSGARRGVSSPWLFLLAVAGSVDGLQGVMGGLFVARFAPDRQNALMVRKSSVAAADASALLHASKLYPGTSNINVSGAMKSCLCICFSCGKGAKYARARTAAETPGLKPVCLSCCCST